jgi:hypothetical protein
MHTMRVFLTVFFCVIATDSAIASYTQVTAPNPNPTNVVIVNDSNGAITQCVALLSGSSPIGRCVRIGITPTASLAGHVQATVVGSIAFITNTVTGYVTTCSVLIDGNGNPTGHCIIERVSTVAASYTQVAAANANSILLINNANGDIIQCGGLVSGSSPIGACAGIGVISSTSFSGHVQVNLVNNIAFITDTGIGVVAECSVLINANGAPTGRCVNMQAQ